MRRLCYWARGDFTDVNLAADAHPLPLAEPALACLDRLGAIPGGALRRLDPGHILLPEGERPSCLWVVRRGAVALSSTSRGGRKATVAILGRGGVIGELGLTSRPPPGRPHAASLPEARALTETLAFCVPLGPLRSAMASDPRLAAWLAVSVGRRASQVHRALVRALALPVPLRLLGVLEDLAAEHGEPEPGGDVWVRLPLTQDLLASMVGATRESVNRAVADLERKGWVVRAGFRYGLCGAPVGSEAVP